MEGSPSLKITDCHTLFSESCGLVWVPIFAPSWPDAPYYHGSAKQEHKRIWHLHPHSPQDNGDTEEGQENMATLPDYFKVEQNQV